MTDFTSHLSVGAFAIFGVAIIMSALVFSNYDSIFEPELDEYYSYENVDKETCFSYYRGMYIPADNSCSSRYPHGLEPCLDPSYSKMVNDGVDYCNPQDNDISPDEMTCYQDVYGRDYCLVTIADMVKWDKEKDEFNVKNINRWGYSKSLEIDIPTEGDSSRPEWLRTTGYIECPFNNWSIEYDVDHSHYTCHPPENAIKTGENQYTIPRDEN